MWTPNTTEILEKIRSFYEDHYRQLFNEYMAELTFETILTYYSGSCAVIVEVKSSAGALASTDLCLMLECSESDLQNLDENIMEMIIKQRIFESHKAIFELHKILCSRKFNRKIIIKNTNFNEPVISIKLDKDTIYLDLNYSKLNSLEPDDCDMHAILLSLSRNLENLV